jgi:hypothetical protein
MKEALKLALETLEESQTDNDTMEFWDRKTKAITAIKAALAQPAQEPVAWMATDDPSAIETSPPHAELMHQWIPLYTTPRQRKPLTVEDVRKAGGIVHKDGNIFFTNIGQMNAALGITEKDQP